MSGTASSRPAREESRLRQVPGGWLLAQDLRDVSALPAQRLAQHTMAAHHSWGCSGGLQVLPVDGRLWVTRGCAVDRCGRTAVLAHAVPVVPRKGHSSLVVLALCGDGPEARVRLREPGAVQPMDIPLARVDGSGEVHEGDGYRQWLRRPGPCRRLGGLVARGAPLLAPGHVCAWTVRVDLAGYRLDLPPAVVASPAGTLPGASIVSTTVEVASVTETHFDLMVRHATNVIVGVAPGVIRTAPHAVAWMAVAPAARPEFPSEEFL